MNLILLEQAAEHLINGKIGVLPTDTVYGLVARAGDEAAVTTMYELKNREQKPGTLIAANIDQLLALGVSQSDIDKVAQWWPNPLSAVLAIVGYDYLHQGVSTLAMRVVADPIVRELLEQTGPLITSSANQPGQPPATTIDEAFAYFGDTVDFYVDGGMIADILPSTIIRPTTDGVEVLRQGSITL
jgi:tRNA threonylcarbamoyl adenosine modification protein (Sua5/YciO/YrdC/YwlC family)